MPVFRTACTAPAVDIAWRTHAKAGRAKIIFSMIAVSKTIERKPILRDISLSFFYGAKIGVLAQRSGKSSLLRILSGLDHDLTATSISSGVYGGLLEQEPQVDPAKRCANASRGVKPLTDLVAAMTRPGMR